MEGFGRTNLQIFGEFMWESKQVIICQITLNFLTKTIHFLIVMFLVILHGNMGLPFLQVMMFFTAHMYYGLNPILKNTSLNSVNISSKIMRIGLIFYLL